jgi:aspartate/glutamate racemase
MFQRVFARMKNEGCCDALVLGCIEDPLIMNDATCPLSPLDRTH